MQRPSTPDFSTHPHVSIRSSEPPIIEQPTRVDSILCNGFVIPGVNLMIHPFTYVDERKAAVCPGGLTQTDHLSQNTSCPFKQKDKPIKFKYSSEAKKMYAKTRERGIDGKFLAKKI